MEVEMNTALDIEDLKLLFTSCQKTLLALGDETRAQILLMMLSGECQGSRVVDIAKKTHLSRPAVSHHMQILKDAGIVKSRKEGTLVYYYLDPQKSEIDNMVLLFQKIQQIMKYVTDRSEESL